MYGIAMMLAVFLQVRACVRACVRPGVRACKGVESTINGSFNNRDLLTTIPIHPTPSTQILFRVAYPADNTKWLHRWFGRGVNLWAFFVAYTGFVHWINTTQCPHIIIRSHRHAIVAHACPDTAAHAHTGTSWPTTGRTTPGKAAGRTP
jgi:hypothetical protein